MLRGDYKYQKPDHRLEQTEALHNRTRLRAAPNSFAAE